MVESRERTPEGRALGWEAPVQNGCRATASPAAPRRAECARQRRYSAPLRDSLVASAMGTIGN